MNRRLLPYFMLVGLVMVAMGGLFTLLGEIRDELGFEEWQLGIMVGVGFIAAFISQLSLARFSDRGHSRVMIRLGLAFLAAGLTMMAIFSAYWVYLLARSVIGVGAGCLLPAIRRIVVVSDPSDVGRNLGTLGAFDVGGFLVGPIIAGTLAQFFDFRAPFVVFAVMTALFVPLAARLPADEGEVTERQAVLRPLLAKRGIRAMLIVAVGWYAMIGLFEAVWAVMLTDRGAEPWMIATTMTIIMVPMLFLAPIGGRLAQRRGPLRIAIVGVLCTIPAVAAYGWIESLWVITLIALFQGAFDSLVFPATQVGAALAADEELAASAQGLQGATLEVVAALAAIGAGFAYDPWGPELIYSMAAALMGVGALCAAVLALPMWRAGDELITGRPYVVPADSVVAAD